MLSSKYVIVNSSNEEVIYDSNGILCRSETDIGEYGEHQLRLNGNGIYLTDDAWDNVREAIGLIQYNGKWVQVSYSNNYDTLQVESVQDTTKKKVIEIELPTYYSPEIDNSMEDNPWNCESGYLALPLEMYNNI